MSKSRFISLKLQAIENLLTDEEVLTLIGTEKLNQIKESDPEPFFQTYCIAHEGTSSPRIVDGEQKPIHWTRKAIQSIKQIVTKGVKFFVGHNEDNSTENRRILGEVVADTQKEIDGNLHHILIAYHSPEVREEAKKYDICSQEAKWELEEDLNVFGKIGRFIADKIEKLTGIALGSSKNDKPAFAGAKRLGMVQAFEIKAVETVEKAETMTKEELLDTITFQEIKILAEKRNVFPTQIFTIDQLKADRNILVFKKLEDLEKTIQEKDKNIKEKDEKNQNLIHENLKANAESRFTAMLSEKDFQVTEKQKSYLSTFKASDFGDLSDEGLKAFRDKELDRLRRMTTATGGDNADVLINNNDPPQTSSSTDYTKAENNPLLDEDHDI